MEAQIGKMVVNADNVKKQNCAETQNYYSKIGTQRCCSCKEVERVCGDLGMRLYLTSVKEDMNVASVFQHLAENYVAKVKSFSDEMVQVISMPNVF